MPQIEIPEQGQIVKLRHKIWAVTNVNKSTLKATKDSIHNVGLECLSDDALGHEIQVIWEREVYPYTIESTDLPPIQEIDEPDIFSAFIRSLQWGSSSLALGDVLQASLS